MPDETKTDFGFERVSPTEKTERVKQVFESVASRYDLMNDLMSFGLHRLWKRFAVSHAKIRAGYQILDLAGGTGDIARLMAKRLGDSGSVVLLDINAEMLDIGRDRTIDSGLERLIQHVQSDAQSLPFGDSTFDLVTMAFGLRNVTDKAAALSEIYRVLKPGARMLVLEFSTLQISALQNAYDEFSFRVLPKLGEVVAKDGDSYRYLAESIRRHPDQEGLKQMMIDAGLERCRYQNLLGGVVSLHEGIRL